MADEQHELRRINWTELFSFTHIFKSFKMAIHFNKMALCLATIVIIFCVGCVMDWFSLAGDSRVYPGEISDHFTKSSWQFEQDKQDRLDRRADLAAGLVAEAESQRYTLNAYRFALPSGALKDALGEIVRKDNEKLTHNPRTVEDIQQDKDYDDLLDEADRIFDSEIDRIKDLLDEAEDLAEEGVATDADSDKLEEDLAIAQRKISERKVKFRTRIRSIRGRTIFLSLIDYEMGCLSNAIASVRHGNILGGLSDYRAIVAGKAIPSMTVRSEQSPKIASSVPANGRAGFVCWGLLSIHAMGWLIREHWIYAPIFLLISLAVVAFFGGAVHRITALHFAREEKMSMRQALRFSASKFLDFFSAPLLPLAIILLFGLFLAFGGFFFGWVLGWIPYVGNFLLGLLFFVAIILGLVIAFLAVGLIAGSPLMYPAIAVEGSDSFDALSRSFGYVFVRPWRAAFYGLVALVHGAITYLFVRFFAYIALASTHCFVKWGVMGGGQRLHQDADKLDVMWTAPTFHSLFGPFNWEAMNSSMSIGAWLIGMWVFLVAASVLAYLLSYAASSTTVIYYLLRQKEDATDLDDVYVEEEEEEDFLPEEDASESEDDSAPPEEEAPETEK